MIELQKTKKPWGFEAPGPISARMMRKAAFPRTHPLQGEEVGSKASSLNATPSFIPPQECNVRDYAGERNGCFKK
jgi:hypothetical protein